MNFVGYYAFPLGLAKDLLKKTKCDFSLSCVWP